MKRSGSPTRKRSPKTTKKTAPKKAPKKAVKTSPKKAPKKAAATTQKTVKTSPNKCKYNNMEGGRPVCLITLEPIEELDLIEFNGHCFSKKALQMWLSKGNETNPITRQPFTRAERVMIQGEGADFYEPDWYNDGDVLVLVNRIVHEGLRYDYPYSDEYMDRLTKVANDNLYERVKFKYKNGQYYV